MFRKLEQKVQSLASQRNTVDPSRLRDPIAMQSDWTHAIVGGIFGDKLVDVSSGRLEYRASVRAKLSYLVFLLAGLGVLIGFSVFELSSGDLSFDRNTIMPILIGLVFSFSGSSLLYFGTAPVVFDKQKGFFWKGRKAPDEVFEGQPIKYCAKLEDIHALQLISEYSGVASERCVGYVVETDAMPWEAPELAPVARCVERSFNKWLRSRQVTH